MASPLPPHRPAGPPQPSSHYQGLLGLPDECLHRALRPLDAQDWVSTAQACSRLRQAAWAGLQAVRALRLTEEGCRALQAFLEVHGRHVTSIKIACSLPRPSLGALRGCPQLRELECERHEQELPRALLEAATGLTRLVYRSVAQERGAADAFAAALARLTSLRHLDCHADGWHALPCAFLSRLTRLTCLLGCPAGSDALLHVERMTGLQRLEFWGPPAAEGFQGQLWRLPRLPRLAWLRCSWARSQGADDAAAVGRLPALQALEVEPCNGFQPAPCLGGLTRLTRLTLHCLDGIAGGAAAGVAGPLEHLARMQQLRVLALTDLFQEGGPPAAAYTALTASSHLEELEISGGVRPDGVWHHIFQPQRPLPRLRAAALSVLCSNQHPSLSLATDEAWALVRCCPGLESLRLGPVEPRRAEVAPLQRLSALTCLELRGTISDELVGRVLGRMTRLCELSVTTEGALSHAGLLQLTALKRLTSLAIDNFMETESDTGSSDDGQLFSHMFRLTNKAPAGRPPDVCAQLPDMFTHSRQVRKVPVRTLAAQALQLAAQARQLQQQERQLAAQAQQLAAQAQQLARLESRMAERGQCGSG